MTPILIAFLLMLSACSKDAAYNLGYLVGQQFSHSIDLSEKIVINNQVYYKTLSCSGYIYYDKNNERLDVFDCILISGVSYISFYTISSIINAFYE